MSIMLGLVGCTAPDEGAPAKTGTASDAPELSHAEESSPTPEQTNLVELGEGHLTFEIPVSWDAELEDITEEATAAGAAPEFNGNPVHQATITNASDTISVDVITNVPWPDVVAVDPDEVELIHAEPFDMGYEVGEAGEGMWLRAVIGENPEFRNGRPSLGSFDGRFNDEQYMLVIAPYFAKADLGSPEELGGGMTGFRFPFTEDTAGDWWDESITIAAGTISQSAAEEITGTEGLEAMQALVGTAEYDQLFEVMNSFEVHVEANG